MKIIVSVHIVSNNPIELSEAMSKELQILGLW